MSRRAGGNGKSPAGSRLRGFCYDANRFSRKSLNLALDTAGTVAACQLLDLGDSDHVVVALDGVLQGRSSNSELNSVLGALAVQQGVDQAAAEGEMCIRDRAEMTTNRQLILQAAETLRKNYRQELSLADLLSSAHMSKSCLLYTSRCV